MDSLKCKNCGAKVLFDGKYNKYICEACGTDYVISNDTDTEFNIVAGTLMQYTGNSSTIVVPAGVVRIGNNCFANIETLESVELPETVLEIGKEAFFNCKKLKSINIPICVQIIGESAFKNSGLQSIIIPQSVNNLGKDAFMECEELSNVSLAYNPKVFYDRTFKQCHKLSDVNFDIQSFCLSIKDSTEARKNGDIRATFFDAFQATPFFNTIKSQIASKKCISCGGTIGKKGICETCGKQYVDFAGGCYVATCVYGSYDCPQVWTLRRYRDCTLAETWYGRAFIHIYYAISPTLVKWFGHTEWFKKMWKGKLDRMVEKLRAQGVEDTPYEDRNW